jgi:hypothetical protein
MTLRYVDKKPWTPVLPDGRPFGHDHFWERALTRRQMIGGTAALVGAATAASILKPLRAFAGPRGAEPRPIPGGMVIGDEGWHVDGPGPSATSTAPTAEMSSIYDFDGIVAAADTQGTGTGRQSGISLPFAFDTDMRFMRGRYRGMDGRMYRGTFGFI